MTPLVSIITPTYNTTTLILETYEALLKQTYKNFEWIIVDDGSKDNHLLALLEEKKDVNIKILYSYENKGPSFCRNLGVHESSGDYVMFLDDDDLYSEYLLEKMVQITDEPPKTIVYARTKKFFEKNNQLFYIMPGSNPYTDFKGLNVLRHSLNAMTMSHCSLLIPKEYFVDIGGYDERLFVDEDGNLLFKLFLEDYEFRRVEDSYHLYRQHNHRDRLSFNESDERIENRILAMELLINELKTSNLLDKFAYEVAMRLDHIALAMCSRSNKILAQKILSRAEEIMPNYLSQRSTFRTILRRLLGCANYDRLLRSYGIIRQKLRGIKK